MNSKNSLLCLLFMQIMTQKIRGNKGVKPDKRVKHRLTTRQIILNHSSAVRPRGVGGLLC